MTVAASKGKRVVCVIIVFAYEKSLILHCPIFRGGLKSDFLFQRRKN